MTLFIALILDRYFLYFKGDMRFKYVSLMVDVLTMKDVCIIIVGS
ncbi:hypothetical protein TCEL_02343 [Thermobrachium celere DSM 8682]|uniref:Uncharacterized protein n=1 Tax=Thermobrachium celere DSM 8682 TaxID=941824 RepID=R7RUQ2_9CLOT|nr:hypothetical protein TCEL_02343 [Thermobrachium celere DSM 8682]